MRISVLGPLRVTEGGRQIAIGGPRQRAVLAFLALHANQIVPGERLVDELWGLPVPAGAANALQAAVSRVRKLLPAGRLVTAPHGYLLRVTADEFDVSEFEQAFARGTRALAADAADEAAVVLAGALALWRGPALADLSFEPFAQAEIARLEEARLACLEARLDADLATGRGADLVPELQQLVADHPLRERLTGQLMLALYRSGRQAEALEAFRGTRDLLGEELGIDPSQALVRLEAAVLRQEPWLDAAPGTAAPPSPAASSSRRPVTVVCVDVGDRSGEGADPEMLHLLAGRARALVGPVLERHGGRSMPAVGRRLLGVLGATVLHEDDAQRAAAAALECRDAVTGLGVACRIGVATAEALVSDADPMGFVGEAVGTAQRLAEACPDGQVLVCGRTYRLAAGALDVEPADGGALTLRGVRFGARSLPVRLEAPVLGRSAELAAIEAACALAESGRTTAFVTVVGDAGMGKTRLVHELARRLDGRATMVTGRCLPYGDGVTFWPLRELVEQVTGGDAAPSAIADVLRGEPDAAVVADRLTRAFGAGEAGTSDTAEIFWATRRLLEAVARQRLLVVVLDDLHWAEPTFLDLVESIALQPGTAPIVVLAVTRPELLEERPDWLAAASTHVVLQVQPLADDAAAALADELARPNTLGAAARERLVRAAGGNPLYLEQLVAAADERPSGTDQAPLPPTLQALLASRLDRLGPAEHEVLCAAAVVGKEFGTAAVAALLPRRIADRLPWHLRTLAAKALVEPEGAPGQHGFRHILVQQAAYRAMPKTARASLHRRLADWAEADAGHAGAQRVEILGYHLAQATSYYRELAEPELADDLGRRATGYLRQAAASSLAIGDAAAAVRAYERALGLMPPDDADRAGVLTGLGAALYETGELGRARPVLQEAEAFATRHGLDSPRAHAVIQQLLLDLHLDPDGATDRAWQALPGIREAFDRAGDDTGRCRAWLLEGALHWSGARSVAAEAAWQQAAQVARAAGDRRHLTRSLRWLASAALWGPTPAGQGIARCRAYLDEIGSTPTGHAVIYLHLAGLHAMCGDLPAARDLRARGTALLQEVGSALPLVLAEPAAFIATLAEDHVTAERHLRGAYEALERMGEEAELSTCAALLARTVAVQGCDGRGAPVPGFDRYDEVTRYVTVSRTSAGGQDRSAQIIGNGAMARALVAGGDPAGAVALAGEAVELAARTDLLNQHGDALLDLAHVLRGAGREDAARDAAAQARALYRRKENRLSARQCDRFLGAGK